MPGSAAPDLCDRLRAARLYVVTGAQSGDRVAEVVRAACAGGADVIQLRRTGDLGLESLRLAALCRRITADSGALFVVNDRLDVAMAADADGVHLGQDDLPLDVARRLWPSRIVGRSTHSAAQVRAAVREGADYIGVGPVYATPTKPGRAAVGPELLSEVDALRPDIPWFAIGGIDASNIAQVRAAGAARVAVVRAVCDASDVRAATASLRAAIVAGSAVVGGAVA